MDDVIVIGGGPAGVAAAVALARRGISATVLEAGARTFAALRDVDPDMELLSPSRLSRLPGMRELDDAPAYLTMGAWIARAERYVARHAPQIEHGVRVTAVRRDRDGFALDTTRGPRRARRLVDATGQLGWPRRPDGLGATDLRVVLARDVRDPDLADARALLLVGGGTSSAELLTRWLRLRPAGAQAWLSRRKRRLVTPRRPLGVDIHYWVWPLEQLSLPAGRRPPHPLTFGGALVTAPLLRPSVHAVGEVTTWGRFHVVVDGVALAPDLIVLATGYRHAAPHLGDLVARHSDGEPRLDHCRGGDDLWMLGVPGGRTPASAFLRGIATDAIHVADRIAA